MCMRTVKKLPKMPQALVSIDNWRQDETLQPPPLDPKIYPELSRMRTFESISEGDKLLDSFSARELLHAVHHPESSEVAQLVFHHFKQHRPQWVNPRSVERGQKVFKTHLYAFICALTGALLNGFVIARFADVLVASGYAQSPKHTYLRFHETALALYRWMCSSLFEDGSESITAVMQVRCIHAFVRRRSLRTWDKIREEDGQERLGTPLCQFDMGLVQLGFSSICLDAVHKEMKVELTLDEREDYIHLWRYLGHLLGIEDQFNVCNSIRVCDLIREEFYSLVPTMCAHPRPSSVILAQSALSGFGKYTGAGKQVMLFLMNIAGEQRPFITTDWCKSPKPKPFAHFALKMSLELISKWSLPRAIVNFIFHSSLTLPTTRPFCSKIDRFMKATFHAPLNDFFFASGNTVYVAFLTVLRVVSLALTIISQQKSKPLPAQAAGVEERHGPCLKLQKNGGEGKDELEGVEKGEGE